MLNTDKKIKVIVFDDDILLGNMIVSFLKEEEMEAIFQSSLYGAVNAVLSFEPDIIVLDVEMGKIMGLSLLLRYSPVVLQFLFYLFRRMLEDMRLLKV